METAVGAHMIRHLKGKWFVYSQDGKKRLRGPLDSRALALKALRQIEYFKHNPPHVAAKSFSSTAHAAEGRAVMAKQKSRLKALIEEVKKEAREISDMSGIPIDTVLATISHQLHGDLVDPDAGDVGEPTDGAPGDGAPEVSSAHPHFKRTFLSV